MFLCKLQLFQGISLDLSSNLWYQRRGRFTGENLRIRKDEFSQKLPLTGEAPKQ